MFSLSCINCARLGIYIQVGIYSEMKKLLSHRWVIQSIRMKVHREIWKTQTGRITGMKTEETGSREGINNTNSFKKAIWGKNLFFSEILLLYIVTTVSHKHCIHQEAQNSPSFVQCISEVRKIFQKLYIFLSFSHSC